MKILPASTQPPPQRVRRAHQPSPIQTYQKNRPCLRWDFGFTCAFCLLHEADLKVPEIPNERAGQMTVEHFSPQTSAGRVDIHAYENLFYCCRYCNRARGVAPESSPQARLLNPVTDVWSEHFRAEEGRLSCRQDDLHAKYTHAAYRLDDPIKVSMRRKREQLITEHLKALPQLKNKIVELTRIAQKHQDPDVTKQIFGALEMLRAQIRRGEQDLQRYRIVPEDAPTHCRCHQEKQLPTWLEDQAQKI